MVRPHDNDSAIVESFLTKYMQPVIEINKAVAGGRNITSSSATENELIEQCCLE